ncbi:hypothetical protein [Sabulicella glaciei]|uniref:Entericidin EcnAB n=1 Tax=Sabulicella glaciei TaxID=2984948 RepID=A0ABT3NY68_9PROT|nr:hypothetical protein [Roseococcus sp. MDT2-1-1]MCW8086858.1 hypothetical protein [Roseococcus sp. MDT2-1-1]
MRRLPLLLVLLLISACESRQPGARAGAALDRAGTRTGDALGHAAQSTGAALDRAGDWMRDRTR